MYAPLVPTHTYKQEELNALPRLKNADGIVDLKAILQNEEKPMIDMYE